ncbi:threonine ammonia-lyase [Thermogladius sp. 4427co]|uniref:threonine ammonia-lyase n=1 Tax=Thermogladius sp. 4427co TaxID=3450718 RepID=UPI003F793267
MGSLLDSIWGLIQDATRVVYEGVHKTPLVYNTTFSRMTGNEVYLKLENMQKTGAFKARGAFYKIYRHIEEAREKGVVTASSGNHAQGVAYASSVLGARATIVMPETTPIFKINATKSYGAEVVLYGSVYDEAYEKAVEIAREKKALFVHPFNDPEVIAGQGTIGVEVFEQLSDVETVLVPIGGGGLVSGVGVALKKLKPSVRIIGVEPENAAKYYASRLEGRIVKIEPKPSIADGVVTKSVGDLTFQVMGEVVDDVVKVDEDSIARAIYLLLERAKILVEGAGALPLAALLSGYLENQGRKIVLLLSGGNIDLTTLHRILMKGFTGEGRVASLKLMLRDIPGQLLRVLDVLYRYRCNVIDIRHDRMSPILPVGYALVEVVFEVPDKDVIAGVRRELAGVGVIVE